MQSFADVLRNRKTHVLESLFNKVADLQGYNIALTQKLVILKHKVPQKLYHIGVSEEMIAGRSQPGRNLEGLF